MYGGRYSDVLGFDDGGPVRRGQTAPAVVQEHGAEEAMPPTDGVSVDWLAAAFGMNRKDVASALRPCPIKSRKGVRKFYDLRTAAGYLVRPERELSAALASLKADDLPERLRESFWNAKMKELKFRAAAGDLWSTASVLDVLGETFKAIKKATQLWADTVEESLGLTPDQRNLVVELSDRLMSDIQTSLVHQAQSSATESYLATLDDETVPSA
ncbi:hypothetical protein HDIA_0788 [Hartmannibacter diazotrophicus]|uniref:Phage DNA packaging protein Nu1 n=1 Tax=Hartmannibacter diazotrophicus TaxID=1482074 RepID=A0A2C9D2C7_9HYPH|nr:DUF1441 family protein [Hartmannibacter diazotrophicus]SON54329.1 hypothetical protein HDIA_0788 [Hartmannibacter diazotrophicus]